MRWHTDSTFGELWRPSSGSTLCTPSLLQRPELPIGVWGCGENRTRADGHAPMLALMYDTYHLWFLFVKNGVPPFLLTGLQVVIHGAFLYAEGLGDFQHRESLLAQGACTRRCGLRRALPTPSVHPALLGEGNAGSLALL